MTASELPFDMSHYLEIDNARMQHLDLIDIGCQGKTLLDVGCGIGRFSDYWASKGCKVLGIDARETNIRMMRERYPYIDAVTANVESEPFVQVGTFDIVFCYGLLYHTENPTRVLRNLAAVTKEALLLETAISISNEAIVKFALEGPGDDQALRSIACRPSERYLIMILAECNFPYIYMPTVWPQHPQFSRHAYTGRGKTVGGNLTRTIMIASRLPIENPLLALADDRSFARQRGQLEYVAYGVRRKLEGKIWCNAMPT